MSRYQDFQSDKLISPQPTSLREGDSMRRMMFNSGYQSLTPFLKKGDDNFPVSILGSDDRYQIELDSINQTNNPLKLNNTSILNKSELKFNNNQRPSMLSVDRLNNLDTQGLVSPKALLSPKDTLRSYSNILSSSQQNSVSDFGYKNGGNIFHKSKTTNAYKRSFTKGESLEQSSPKKKLRKSKTQKFMDDSKTDNNQHSHSKEEDMIRQMTSMQQKTAVDIKPKEVEQIAVDLGMNYAWRKRGIYIITLVRKFLTRLQNLSYILKYKNQTEHQFYVINDLSASYEESRRKIYQQQKSFMKVCWISLKRQVTQNPVIYMIVNFLGKNLKVFEPDQIYIIIWMIILIVSILLLLFFTPIFMAFQKEMEKDGYLTSPVVVFCMSRLPLFVMLADVAIRLNTAYYKRGLIVVQRWNIARHYLKHKMWVDFCIIFLFTIYSIDNINILMIITLLLIKKIIQVRQELEDAFTLDKKKYAIYQLGKLSVFVIIIAHFCGCIFWSIGMFTSDTEKSWIEDRFTDKTFYEKYVSCLYWATVTMLTVGYGDIVPQNKVEKQFVIVIMIFSCGIYAYSLNQIGVLIGEITYEDKEFKQIYSQLSLFLKKRNLDVKLQTEVKRYYQYLHYEKHNYIKNGEEMLKPLTHSLRQKVIENINYQLLIKYKMFKFQFSQKFLEQLAFTMKENECMPDDKVWESADLPKNNRLFFVIRGQIIQKVNNQFLVRTIEQGGYFNEKCFMIDETPNISFVSTCLSTIVYLDKKDFLEVIKNFPVDYERYCKLRDGSKNSNIFNLDSKCETCDLYTHSFNNCLQVNSYINKAKIFYNLTNWKPTQEREFRYRRMAEELNQSFNSGNMLMIQGISGKDSGRKDINYTYKRVNARAAHYTVLESVVDFLINKNPFGFDEDNLIEYMKTIFEYNDTPNDIPSPDQIKQGQIVSNLVQNHDSKHRSLIIHPIQIIGSRFQEELVSPSKQQQQFKQFHIFEEMYQRQQSGQESQQGSVNQYYQQYSKTSTRGNQPSIGPGAGGGAYPSTLHLNNQSNNTPLGTKESGNYSRRIGGQSHQSKTISQTEIPSNENLKDLPNETDIRHNDKFRQETDGRRRVSTGTKKSQNLVTNSLTYNSNSPFPSQNMAQSSGAQSSYSAPPADMNNSLISIEHSINYENMLLQSNEQDELNVSEALKNLQSKRKKNQKYTNNHAANNNSTFTILEEETQENQTNFQKTLHINTNFEQDNTLDQMTHQNEESSFPQPDLYPKIRDENSQVILSAKLILDTDRINTSLNMMNQNNQQNNNNSLQNYQNPGSVNTPGTITAKRNSISNKYANFIRSSSHNPMSNPINPMSNPISPMNRKSSANNKGFLYSSNSREQEGFFPQRMNSIIQNSKGGSQYGQHGEEMIVQMRNRKKTEGSLNKQHSFQRYLNRIKEDATPKNNSKPKVSSNNFIPSLQNLYGNYLEEDIIFVSPKTHEFSDVPNLDKYHLYTDYFPFNNIDKIMAQLKEKYEKIEKERRKKKSETQLSKLEKFMIKFNSKRTSSRNKTSRQSISPLRQKTKKKTINPLTKSTFHQQHSSNKI